MKFITMISLYKYEIIKNYRQTNFFFNFFFITKKKEAFLITIFAKKKNDYLKLSTDINDFSNAFVDIVDEYIFIST